MPVYQLAVRRPRRAPRSAIRGGNFLSLAKAAAPTVLRGAADLIEGLTGKGHGRKGGAIRRAGGGCRRKRY